MGLLDTGKRYTDKDIEFLKENYKDKGTEWCAKQLGRTSNAIRTTACRWKIQGKIGSRGNNKTYENIEGIFGEDNLNFDTAYILGNSIADVTLYNSGGHNYRLVYDISGEPKYYEDNHALLEFIRKYISPNRPIKKYKR